MTDGAEDGEVRVESAGVTVTKAFVMDEFPVPAVRFDVESGREEPVDLQLVDEIPESFPMDNVGFHPDFESDNWAAYRDHRVEYRRELAPGESVTTVYGIRTDDPAVGRQFDAEPTVTEVDAGGEDEADAEGFGDVEEVLGPDSAEAVRDVVAGDRDGLPGLDQAEEELRSVREGDTEATAATADIDGDGATAAATNADSPDDGAVAAAVPDDPLAGGAVGDDAEVDDDPLGEPTTDRGDGGAEPELDLDVGESGESGETADGVTDDAESAPADAAGESDGESVADVEEASDDVAADATGATDAEPAPARSDTGGVAAALAAEIRAGRVADDDLDTLRSELDLDETPASVDVRLSQLQSQMATLAAYTEALEEFLDENGRGHEILEQVESELDAVTAELETVSESLATAEEERSTLSTDLADATEAIGDVDDRVADAAGRIDDLDDDVEAVEAELADLRTTVDDHDGALADVIEEADTLVDDVERVESRLDEVDALAEEVDRIAEEIEGLSEFRERVSSAFGGSQ